VASGPDRFYAYKPKIDPTGAVVDWCVQQMQKMPFDSTLLVLPEGVMINYLSRHERPMPEFESDEPAYVKALAKTRPDYIIIIWGDQRDSGISQFGDPNQPGATIREWLEKNYVRSGTFHGGAKWAFIFRKKSSVKN
jgi:hypothetical protein